MVVNLQGAVIYGSMLEGIHGGALGRGVLIRLSRGSFPVGGLRLGWVT